MANWLRNHSKLSSQHNLIYKDLRWDIATLILPPGELLSENILAKKFGISRTPIRKVLNELEKDNFVETKIASGTYVTSLNKYDFDQIYQLRISLIQSMEILSPKPTFQSDLLKLKSISNKGKIKKKSKLHLAQIITELYEFCLEFIGNRPLRILCESLYYHSLRFFMTCLPDKCLEDEYQKFNDECRDITYAILTESSQALFSFRKAYLEISYHNLKKYKKSHKK